MVETTGINIPSGDFAFSIIGRWPRAREGARARVRNIEIGELSIGEALEAVGVVARVKVLPGNCSHEVDAEGGRTLEGAWWGDVRCPPTDRRTQ